MSNKNKVIWSEGLFLKPQHFQQHDRYLEAFVEGRCRGLHNHSWGLTEFVLDADQLSVGKIAIARAKGVFPDGTPFDMPDHDRPPPALDIDESVRDCRVHLALPVRHEGQAEVSGSDAEEGLTRYVAREVSASDVSDYGQGDADMRVGTLRTRLLLDTDQRDDYVCLGVVHVVEAKADRSVKIESSYVPPNLNVQTSPWLSGFVSELNGLLHHRGEALGGRITGAGQGGAAEVSDLLMLQAINRYEPVVAHLASLNGLHPEALFRELISIAGDLCTFDTARRPGAFPPYDHDELTRCFEPVMNSLRRVLGTVIEERAVSIPLDEPRYGIRVGLVNDRTLLESADFVLAVRSAMPSEELRSMFPPQTKIGSVEGIKQLVKSGVPGIPLQALPVAPRQLPFHADYVYFQLDRGSSFWADMATSGGIAIYVAGGFPDMDMQFWAVRR